MQLSRAFLSDIFFAIIADGGSSRCTGLP